MKTPTWFLTLSSADLYWPELFIAIDNSLTYESAAQLSMAERRKLLNSNSTMACRMFRERIECLLKRIILKGKFKPLGRVIDWWFRVEFQSRGSLHVHSILWALLMLDDGVRWIDGDEQAELFRRCLKSFKEPVTNAAPVDVDLASNGDETASEMSSINVSHAEEWNFPPDITDDSMSVDSVSDGLPNEWMPFHDIPE